MRLVHEALERSARRWPDKVAVVCGDERVTYADLDRRANRLANALLAYGVDTGDRVAVFLDNSVETVVSIFGALKAGAAFTVVSPSTKAEKLAFLLSDEHAAALIVGSGGAQRKVVAELAAESLPTVVIWAPDIPPESTAGAYAWTEVMAEAPAHPPAQRISVRQVGTIIYTSGTSGEPKGVVSLHSDMVFAARSINAYLGNTVTDVIYCALQLAFTYGLYQLITAVTAGSTLILERDFMFPSRALEVMQRERVTAFPGVPTMFNLLLRMQVDRYDLASLRYLTNAAAPMPIEQIQQLRAAFPTARFFSMYGQTECKRACYLPPDQLDRRPESVGVPIPGTRAYVADEAGRPVAPGVVGELVIVGRHLMAGYWERPDLTAQRLRRLDGSGEIAMFTGDLFRSDVDGYLYFVSRADDVIKTRGEKVSPIEVERAVRRLPGVSDVAAVGVPDPIFGQTIMVHVVPEPGVTLTDRDVKRVCLEHLEDFMVPRHVRFCDALPTNENGKTVRARLRTQVA